MLAITRFHESDASFVAELETVAELWRGKPGNLSVDVLRNIDDEALLALVSHWENVGAYRRALSGYETKMLLTPVMLRAIDEPGAYLPVGEF